MADLLFDMEPVDVEPPEKLSADRRRTLRQQQALASRRHPLGLAFRILLPLHPDAPPAGDRDAPGPRCGGCRHIARVGHHDRSYLKCRRDPSGQGGTPFETYSAATDLRAWWPACQFWQVKDR